tara:strand:- start:272 stop:955 length:684 start_codon:yes stop_codon:yes gene_type:complete
MSSSDALHPQQLRMFIPAGELMDPKQYLVHSFEHLAGESTKDVQARKLEESKQPYYVPETDEKPHGGGVWNSLSSGAQIEKPIRLVGQADLKEQEGEGIIRMRKGVNPQALVRDGMHRIAAAADVDPKMEVPVQWDRNIHWEHDRLGRPADPPPPEPESDPLEGGLRWSKNEVPGGPYKIQRESDTNLWHQHHYDRGADDWVKQEHGMSEGETRKFLVEREDHFPNE